MYQILSKQTTARSDDAQRMKYPAILAFRKGSSIRGDMEREKEAVQNCGSCQIHRLASLSARAVLRVRSSSKHSIYLKVLRYIQDAPSRIFTVHSEVADTNLEPMRELRAEGSIAGCCLTISTAIRSIFLGTSSSSRTFALESSRRRLRFGGG